MNNAFECSDLIIQKVDFLYDEMSAMTVFLALLIAINSGFIAFLMFRFDYVFKKFKNFN